MSLDNLDAPLRITWDLCPAGQAVLSDAELHRIAKRLLDAGIFYLLLDERPLLHPGLPAVLSQLSSEGCQVSLVLGDDPDELLRLDTLERRYPLLVDAAYWLAKPAGIQGLESFIQNLTADGQKPSLLWVPVAGQLHNLYPLFELCERLSIPRFKLPNHKITANSGSTETAKLLRPNDLAKLAQLMRQQPLKSTDTALEIHDLFLWELIFPQGGGERSEYGGCQAGNSLGHIAVNGAVWPCSSWPQTMGNLLQTDLLSVWDSAIRRQVRVEVVSEPADCAGCSDYPICFGGCRGLARSCRPDDARRDLLCTGPR